MRLAGVRGIGAISGLCLAAALILPAAALGDQTITSAGPLTAIGITSDLNCSVNHTGDSEGEWYGDTACGTLIASGGTLYGPASIPAGDSASPRTAYTPVSQSNITGTGTNVDPFKITTVVDLGTSNLRLTETDTYVVGQESYRTDMQLLNNGGSSANAIIYHAGDCFLANSDTGYGAHDLNTGSVSCVESVDDGNGGTVPGTRIEQFLPLSAGSNSYENDYDTVWARIGAQMAFDDSCLCDEDIDNGIGVSWNVTLGAGQSASRSTLTTFSPTGQVPLVTAKSADSSTVSQGGSDGYTITISNPNTSAVALTSITDTLPAGFSYTAGSTTGVTTNNPTINGQDLTWSGSFSVPAASGQTPGTVTLHFGVTASNTPGDYFNNAGATSDTHTVAPTGDTAQVTVLGATHTLTVTKSGNGSGTVTSSPAGINCGATCSHAFGQGSTVTLSASADSGSTFAGWSGEGCTGTGTCQVTMSQARTVTATFTLVKRTLTVTKNGSGTGTVTSSPAGINCGASCSADYDHGTSVTLTGTPGANSQAVQWSGCDSVNGSNQCVVSMTSAKTVTATFNLVKRTLTVSRTGTGSGTVTSSPAGINCGAGCIAVFDHGTSVTLTATPAAGSVFAGWSGDCSGASCALSMTANHSVTATFTANVPPPPPPPTATCHGEDATIVGTDGNDNIKGTRSDDVIVALDGNDKVNAKAGDDIVCMGDGKDHAVGGTGKDKLFGEAGKDHLIGNAGNDRLDGGPGDDKCQGGAGQNSTQNCEA
jgi:uncharacterized repeat protein (TIGR01451 family)